MKLRNFLLTCALALGTLFTPSVSRAQVTSLVSRGAPVGNCNIPTTDYDLLTGNIYSCGPNGWTLPSGGSGSNVSTPAVVPGALGDYRFLDGSGTKLTDFSGNGNNGILGGGSAGTPTWGNLGLTFSGQQGVQLPAALNSAETLIFGVYINPVTPTDIPLQTYYLLASSGLGNTGLNLMIQGMAGTSFSPEAYTFAPTIFANVLDKTSTPDLVSGFHVIGFVLGTGGGNLDHVYIDGHEAGTYTNQGSSAGFQTSTNLYIGSSNTGVWTVGGIDATYYRTLVYAGQLSAAQMLIDAQAITAEVAMRGIPTTPVPVQQSVPTLFGIGDSITFGFEATTPYLTLLSLTNQPAYVIVNDGIPSITMRGTAGTEPNRVAPKCKTSSGPAIASVFAGTNDIFYNNSTATQIGSWMASETQTLKAAGCRVFLMTMLSRNGFDTNKDALDSLILEQYKAWGAEGVIDDAASPPIGADGASLNTTYFNNDKTHPTNAGHALIAAAYSNTLNYYNGYTVANPNVITATTYTLASGDGAITAAPTANAAYTMPDCTGPSGVTYTISNPQSAFTVTIVGGSASQPINGLTTAITIPSNSTVRIHDVANPKNVSGCHWVM